MPHDHLSLPCTWCYFFHHALVLLWNRIVMLVMCILSSWSRTQCWLSIFLETAFINYIWLHALPSKRDMLKQRWINVETMLVGCINVNSMLDACSMTHYENYYLSSIICIEWLMCSNNPQILIDQLLMYIEWLFARSIEYQ